MTWRKWLIDPDGARIYVLENLSSPKQTIIFGIRLSPILNDMLNDLFFVYFPYIYRHTH
jgi:hypothetical protein